VRPQAPDAATWARLYLGYLKAVRELEEAHHWCSHPQRRPAVHAALLAALGRLLEVSWSAAHGLILHIKSASLLPITHHPYMLLQALACLFCSFVTAANRRFVLTPHRMCDRSMWQAFGFIKCGPLGCWLT